ncbi:MAG TPA: site-specific integrase [Aigarchaeota archaeon]|nr:site-specific integrase [Aigarchaeota archaeon]
MLEQNNHFVQSIKLLISRGFTMLRLEKIPTWEEVKLFWERARKLRESGELELSDYLFFGFVFFTGCRISEILNLKKKDINLKRLVAIIRQLKKRKEFKREVIIPEFLREDLKVYLEGLEENKRLFPFARNTAYLKVKALTGFNPHAFRHTFAIEILKRTNNLEYARRLLGHSNYNTLKHYLDFTVEDIKEKLEGMF